METLGTAANAVAGFHWLAEELGGDFHADTIQESLTDLLGDSAKALTDILGDNAGDIVAGG